MRPRADPRLYPKHHDTTHTNMLAWLENVGVSSSDASILSIATQHSADDADLYFEHGIYTTVALSDRAVNRAHTGIDLGMGVRVVVGDQVGCTYGLTLESMRSAAATAASIARGGRASRIPEHTLGNGAILSVNRFWETSRWRSASRCYAPGRSVPSPRTHASGKYSAASPIPTNAS